MAKIEAKPKEHEIDLSMKIMTSEGPITVEELIEKRVQKRLEKLRKRISPKRKLAMQEFCKLMFQKGSVVDTRRELFDIAKKAGEKQGIGFTPRSLLKEKLVVPVEKTIEDKVTNRKFKVKFYVLSSKRYEEVFGEPLAPRAEAHEEEEAEGETEVTEVVEPETEEEEKPEESIEKAIEEATKE